MKDIVIITNFSSDFSETDNDRFLYLAKRLAKSNQVEIITSDFCHEKKAHRNYTKFEWPFTVTFLSEPGYAKNVCLKRFYSHFAWGRNVKKYLSGRKKPDVIYCAIPSLTAAFYAAKHSKINGIKYIIDVQDLWPEAFQMIVDIPVISDIAFFPFKCIANAIYRQADVVCAVSETYVKRALSVNKKCTKGYSVFLGTNLRDFDKYAGEKKENVDDQRKLKLAYCGTLGSSYDLTCVIDALAYLKENEKQTPVFVVMGDGPRKKEFEDYAKLKGVETFFTGRLPYKDMCAMLASCDMVVNPIVKGTAASIINKHADYAASGLPLLNTQEIDEYCKLVKQYNMGYNCKNGDFIDLASKLSVFMENEVLRLEMGKNARICAEDKFDREKTYKTLIQLIEEN